MYIFMVSEMKRHQFHIEWHTFEGHYVVTSKMAAIALLRPSVSVAAFWTKIPDSSTTRRFVVWYHPCLAYNTKSNAALVCPT